MPQTDSRKGRGGFSSPTESKVLKLEKIDKRIATLDKELKDFQNVEEKIYLMGRIPRTIYKELILKEANHELIAMQLGISERQLYYAKGGLYKFIATELGEYFDEKDLED